MDDLAFLGVVFLCVISVCALIETGLLVYAYFNADKVECSWWGCKFTETRSTIEQNSKCYTNGVKVNCSNIDFPDIDKLVGS